MLIGIARLNGKTYIPLGLVKKYTKNIVYGILKVNFDKTSLRHMKKIINCY